MPHFYKKGPAVISIFAAKNLMEEYAQKGLSLPKRIRLIFGQTEETGDFSEPLTIGGGTYARAMDNTIAFGPNFPREENLEHQANEYITLENMERLRRIYRGALPNLLEMD